MQHEEIIKSQPCIICGDQTLSILELWENNIKISERFMCRPCQGLAVERSHALRKIFDRLLANGLSKKLANEVMIKWYVEPNADVA